MGGIIDAVSNRMAVVAIIVAVLVMLTAAVSTCMAETGNNDKLRRDFRTVAAERACWSAVYAANARDWTTLLNMFEYDQHDGNVKSLATMIVSSEYVKSLPKPISIVGIERLDKGGEAANEMQFSIGGGNAICDVTYRTDWEWRLRSLEIYNYVTIKPVELGKLLTAAATVADETE